MCDGGKILIGFISAIYVMRCCPRLCVYQLVLRANVSANRQKWRGLHQSNVIPIEIGMELTETHV